ncbi:MAG: acetoin utilization protein AcuC [Gemmatimonadetes bacterium]|nr:acetoin utilization protein AcuC [Gemmatimonadota bacterium]NIQ53116.1 acetoin utilization protein AcuC [Gemmatimonadota bacterium]NIU73262.1 acetoin utilization protein AcuC [Gammaproteobacteria bacterium]NIX43525.1 acetoin utilization protein AcuC [Gemmatimonadota bacterium]NIY07703.1 acetoin utilization protein AcuC [Gemmatimonadota bacterium]
MPCALVWTDELARYRFRPDHPLDPLRLELTVELLRAMALVGGEECPVVEPEPATDEDLLTVHEPDYVEAVRIVSHDPWRRVDPRFGLGTEDVPIVARMHEMARAVVGSTLTAARLVASGRAARAFGLAGGLHHAHAAAASGFCVYNDLAVAIDWLQREAGYRVMYIDFDAHHGDGVQDIFYRDPDVFTVSLHESGLYLFPATGFVDEVGEGDGHGSAANVPLEAQTEDDSFVAAFDGIVPDLAGAFQPDVIVLQAGCDAHAFDPLTHLRCTTNLYERLTRRVVNLAERHCEGRLVVTGGGGYAIRDVVPRAWTLTWAAMCGVEAPDAIPASWLERIRADDPTSRSPDTLRDPPDLVAPSPRREEVARANELTVRALKRRLMPLVTGWGLGF